MFKKGEQVKWASQAGSSSTEKTGEVIAVIPAGTYANPIKYRDGYDIRTMGFGSPRKHESYLVAVQTRKDPSAKKALYWPRVKNLQVVPGDTKQG